MRPAGLAIICQFDARLRLRLWPGTGVNRSDPGPPTTWHLTQGHCQARGEHYLVLTLLAANPAKMDWCWITTERLRLFFLYKQTRLPCTITAILVLKKVISDQMVYLFWIFNFEFLNHTPANQDRRRRGQDTGWTTLSQMVGGRSRNLWELLAPWAETSRDSGWHGLRYNKLQQLTADPTVLAHMLMLRSCFN